jgi:hypothetical protein
MDAFEPHTLLLPAGLILAAAIIGYISVYVVRFLMEIFTWVLVTVLISAVVSLVVVSLCQNRVDGCSIELIGDSLRFLGNKVFGDGLGLMEVARSYYRLIKRYPFY